MNGWFPLDRKPAVFTNIWKNANGSDIRIWLCVIIYLYFSILYCQKMIFAVALWPMKNIEFHFRREKIFIIPKISSCDFCIANKYFGCNHHDIGDLREWNKQKKERMQNEMEKICSWRCMQFIFIYLFFKFIFVRLKYFMNAPMRILFWGAVASEFKTINAHHCVQQKENHEANKINQFFT